LVLLVIIIMSVIGGVIGGVTGGVIGGVFGFTPDPLNRPNWIFRAVNTSVSQGLATPIALISLVLIYYDRRVRKEGYDAKALAEDLAR
jgi:hypothetical protein